MIWFFAALIVLVMGGVAAVAAGRGQPMSEAYADQPDALVPATGPLRPGDLRSVRFTLALRGYRMSEVDTLLDRLARQLEEQEHEQAEEHADDQAHEHTGEPLAEPAPQPAEDVPAATPQAAADEPGRPGSRGDDHSA